MKRLVIDRIVVDAGSIDPGQADAFRQQLQRHLEDLIAAGTLPDSIAAAQHIDAGQIAAPAASESLAQTVAQRVVRSLGGQS